MCWGLKYCTARAHIVLARKHIVLAREQIVPAIVCGQNIMFSSCNSIHSTPSCLYRTWFLIQVPVLGFSYLCATWRSQNFYRVGIKNNDKSLFNISLCLIYTVHRWVRDLKREGYNWLRESLTCPVLEKRMYSIAGPGLCPFVYRL
jgi:hypothetical protein